MKSNHHNAVHFFWAVIMLLLPSLVYSQTTQTLAIQDFETSPKTPTWGFSGSPSYNSGYSSSGSSPANSEIGIGGSRAWELTSVSGGVVLEFDNVTIPSGYDSIKVKFKLAAMNLTGTSGGPDNLDYVLVEVSTNGGSSYYNRLRIRGATTDNSTWEYSASGVGELYYTPQTEVTFQPTASGLRTTDGYSTGIIVFPGSISQVRVKITMRSSSSSDTWLMDNVEVEGESTCPGNLGSSRSVAICQGKSFFAQGGSQTKAGIYYDTLKTTKGCDSVIKTTLTVNPVYAIQNTATICGGDSILVNGRYLKNNGVYTDSLKTILGCDSIIKTTLKVNPSHTIQNTTTICSNDSVLVNGRYLKISGAYKDSLKTTLGCDSIITTTLIVKPSYTIQNMATICANDSIRVNGRYLKTGGTYKDTLKTTLGCDSIITTTIIVKPVYTIQNTVSICANDSVRVNGRCLKTGGVYKDSLKTTLGCDSLIITTLIVKPVHYIKTTASICGYDSLLINGRYVKTAGTYIDSLKTTLGCDSVIETTVSNNGFSVTIAPSGTNGLIASIAGGNYKWLDCNNNYTVINGAIQQTYTATKNGQYAVEATKNGCIDTSACYSISTGTNTLSMVNALKVYPNPAHEQITIDLGEKYADASVEIITITGQIITSIDFKNEQILNLTTQHLSNGVYLLRIKGDGNVSVMKIHIN